MKKMKLSLFLGMMLLCIGLCTGCSDEDDFEIYAVLYGVVTDYESGEPIENATITLSPTSFTQTTELSGRYRFEKLDAQQYTITVQKTGYKPNRKTVTAISGEEMEVNIPLSLINPKEEE